jgi:hypothetical protein
MINLRQNLQEEMKKGREGKNVSIPIALTKLGDYIEIGRNTMYTIGGITGSGKSTIVQEVFLLSVMDWWMKNKHKTSVKLSVIYFGMERKMFMYAAKWISRAIFREQGINIPYMKILHRRGKSLDEKEAMLVETYMEIFEKWQEDEALIVFEGTKNPTGISIFIDNFAKKHGEVIPRQDGELESRSYKSHHENHLVLIITDHIGILKREKVEGRVKDNIDKFSTAMRDARDLYGFSPVIVQQLNRSVSDVSRLKLNDTLPKLSDFAETSSTSHDSDVVLALLDPYAILPEGSNTDVAGYQLNKMRDNRGAKFYRSLHILKNSFDSNGIMIPLAFHPYFGMFKDMKCKSKDMTDADYEAIIDGSWFLAE